MPWHGKLKSSFRQECQITVRVSVIYLATSENDWAEMTPQSLVRLRDLVSGTVFAKAHFCLQWRIFTRILESGTLINVLKITYYVYSFSACDTNCTINHFESREMALSFATPRQASTSTKSLVREGMGWNKFWCQHIFIDCNSIFRNWWMIAILIAVF